MTEDFAQWIEQLINNAETTPYDISKVRRLGNYLLIDVGLTDEDAKAISVIVGEVT